MDKDERAIRGLVRRSRPTLPSDVRALPAMYDHFGIPCGEVFTTSELSRVLMEKVAAALEHVVGPDSTRLDALEHQLLMRHVADGEETVECIALVSTLRDATRMKGGPAAWLGPPLTRQAPWLRALALARDFHLVTAQPLDATQFMNERVVAVADAAKTVRRYGFRVSIQRAGASLERSEHERVAREIERRVHRLGAFDLAEAVFRSIAGRYDPVQQRYHLVRHVSTTGRAQPSSLPVGYLLQLAMKQADAPRVATDPATEFKELVELATAYVRTFDVEPSSTFELMFKDHSTLVPFLLETAVYDGVCTLVQSRPRDVGRVLRGCFTWLDDATARSQFGWTIGDVVAVSEAVFAAIEGEHGPGLVSERDVQQRAPSVAGEAVRAILDACAHEPTTINAEYLLPHEQAKISFGCKPLIRLGGDFLIADPSWCAPAFYEAIADRARAVLPGNVDTRIGLAAEQFVRDELRAHGVPVLTGKYRVDGKDGECDAVIEAADAIIIIEMKKKVLTRAARGGDTLKLLMDVAKSLLDAQIQAARHELALYRHETLTLRHAGGTDVVERRGRRIERIALTQLDFGALQDRRVISHVLRLLAGATVRSTDGEHGEEIAALEKTCRELLDVHTELATHRVVNPHDCFFNCWFLSLGHLLVMLDNVSSAEDLKRELFLTRNVTMGALDFYFEYAKGKELRAQADRWGAPAESVLITASPNG